MADNQAKLTAKTYLKELATFHRFTIQGLIILTVAILGMSYLGDSESPAMSFKQGSFMLLMLGVFVIVYTAGWLFRRKMHKNLIALTLLPEKLQKYRLYFLLKLISWKLIGLLSMVGFYIAENYVFLLITAIALAGIVVQKPRVELLAKECDLSFEQKKKMATPEFIIS